jgi:hypothetical protein
MLFPCCFERVHLSQYNSFFYKYTAMVCHISLLLPQGANDAVKAASAKKFRRPAQYIREAFHGWGLI